MSLHELLCGSARRWATTALDAYMEDPPDLDFAVHHMAVAVEHLSKAYLCSVSDVLLVSSSPSLDDLLILAGHEHKTRRPRSSVKTIGGDVALSRVAEMLGRPPAGSSNGLRRLVRCVTASHTWDWGKQHPKFEHCSLLESPTSTICSPNLSGRPPRSGVSMSHSPRGS
jgi:hypothetical protein